MEFAQVRAILAAHQAELHAMGVKSLAVFGSVARGEAGPESDVDLLVEFDRPVSLFDYAGVQIYLEELLGAKEIDLVMRHCVIKELQGSIYREAIRVL